MKLEVGIDMRSNNIDENRAQTIAKEIDNVTKSKEKDVVFENDIVDKVEYVSTKVLRDCSDYAVGAFNGREMHITSLKGNVQRSI